MGICFQNQELKVQAKKGILLALQSCIVLLQKPAGK